MQVKKIWTRSVKTPKQMGYDELHQTYSFWKIEKMLFIELIRGYKWVLYVRLTVVFFI